MSIATSKPASNHIYTNLFESRRMLLILIGIIVTCSAAIANPADLDPTFGAGGKVISSPDGSNTKWANSMVLQPDGKIVMAGGGGSPGSFVVARYNANGSLDTDFGTGGFTLVTFPAGSAAYDVALQSDGKIVVGGFLSVPAFPGTSDLCAARLNSDGSLDSTFDGDGKAVVSFNAVLPNAGYLEELSSIRVASDGKIVISGHALFSATDDRFLLARLNADGAPDPTFGTNGLFVDASNGSTHNNALSDMVILADGSIVAAGFALTVSSNSRFVVKYNSTGTGRVWTYSRGIVGTFPGFGHALFGIAALPDGKFIAVGKRDSKIVVERINANGTADNTFVDAPGMPIGQALSAGIQADGKIVANYSVDGTSNYSLMRFNADGSLDTSFGGGGFSNTSIISPVVDSAKRVIVQPDGKILVGGRTGSPGQYSFAIVRYRGGAFVPEKTLFDYDGDHRTDVSVYRPSNAVWYLNRSTAGFIAVQFGISTDRIVPADYDGDGKTDMAIYRDGEWWILQSSNSVVRALTFGIAEDKPQSGDFDGDGLDDVAVFRPSTGVWYVLRSTDNGYFAVPFGLSTDIPQRGDYDDDGKADLAVFRPSNGTWYLQKSLGGISIIQFGLNGDIPVAADYDGDSIPDLAVWRPSLGDWYILRSSNGQTSRINFGLSTDVPVPGDYEGDGKVDVAVFRPSTGVWYQIQSSNGQWASQVFGISTDRATPSAYGP